MLSSNFFSYNLNAFFFLISDGPMHPAYDQNATALPPPPPPAPVTAPVPAPAVAPPMAHLPTVPVSNVTVAANPPVPEVPTAGPAPIAPTQANVAPAPAQAEPIKNITVIVDVEIPQPGQCKNHYV